MWLNRCSWANSVEMCKQNKEMHKNPLKDKQLHSLTYKSSVWFKMFAVPFRTANLWKLSVNLLFLAKNRHKNHRQKPPIGLPDNWPKPKTATRTDVFFFCVLELKPQPKTNRSLLIIVRYVDVLQNQNVHVLTQLPQIQSSTNHQTFYSNSNKYISLHARPPNKNDTSNPHGYIWKFISN